MKIIILFIILSFFLNYLHAKYVFINEPTVHVSSDGYELISDMGTKYTLASSADIPADGGRASFIVVLFKNDEGTYRVVCMLHQSMGDDRSVQKYIPPLVTEAVVSRDKLMAMLKRLVAAPDVTESAKGSLLVSLSNEIALERGWEDFYSRLYYGTNSMALRRRVLPVLCINGKNFLNSIKDVATLDDMTLGGVVEYSQYTETSRRFFIEALDRPNSDLQYTTLNKLRGSADIKLIERLKRFALNEDPKLQWAAFMCLSSALRRPIEAPSLQEYMADPVAFARRLGEILLR